MRHFRCTATKVAETEDRTQIYSEDTIIEADSIHAAIDKFECRLGEFPGEIKELNVVEVVKKSNPLTDIIDSLKDFNKN